MDNQQTKYVLHGGDTSTDNEQNRKFYAEADIVGKDEIKVLAIYFHREDSKGGWEEQRIKHQQKFEQAVPNKKWVVTYGNWDTEKFRQQIIDCDVIFIPGGNTFPILDNFRLVPDLAEIIKGKILLGSSGGAYAVCKYFFENEYPGVYHGLGLVPYKIVAHWGSNYEGFTMEDWQNVDKKLRAYREELEVIELPELEYRVIYT
jgi:hypothetical protein